MEHNSLPSGWKRLEDDAGQVHYLTRHPVVKISKRYQLEDYHRKGRYKEMNVDDLDFGIKKRCKKFSFTNEKATKDVKETSTASNVGKMEDPAVGEFEEVAASGRDDLFKTDKEKEELKVDISFLRQATGELVCHVEIEDDHNENVNKVKSSNVEYLLENDQEDEMVDRSEDFEGNLILKPRTSDEARREAHLENETEKLEKAVKKLTLKGEEAVEHKDALVEAAKNLKDVRMKTEQFDLQNIDIKNVKTQVASVATAEDLLKVINKNSDLKQIITSIEHSKILEQLLKISSLPDNPLTEFPLDVNRNHYLDIINFALNEAPDVLGLVLKLSTKNEAPIAESDVVRCAYMFSSLACSVSRKNNALKKTKSVSTKNNGLSNNGLDVLASAGIFETSRTYRNDRDFLASLNDHILRNHAKISVAQVTFDNLDMNINNVMHHMTLPYLEFETEDTSNLSTDENVFDTALELFTEETVLITSRFNKELFSHYQYVTAWTLGRIFAEAVNGFSWLKRVFPKHYKHPNSETSKKKSTIFTQKPLNYSENNNSDMIKIMEHLQRMYLNLVGEQVEQKDRYFQDLKIIYCVETDRSVREMAEERVKEEVKKAGEMICHGDLLTDVRFESCKRLRRMAVTAVERFDFLKIFRLGTFHLGMNKVIQDIVAGMKSEVNVEDSLSLGYFKTVLGLHHISNQPDVIKRSGNFEHHSQFCEDIGTEILIEAFKTYLDEMEDSVEHTEDGAVKLILDFLKNMDIKYFFDPDNNEELGVHDDMMSSCKDTAGRTVVSLVLDSVEHEGDGLGLRAVRTVMIPYFLNRKENIQDSKYASRLLFNRIWFLQSSKRTQARIDLMACCNPSGKPGHSIARDMENEHRVKNTKNILRGQHSQLSDIPVEKAVLGSNIMELVDRHDKQAMLVLEEGGKSSYRYLNEAQKLKIREEIQRMKPFDYKRNKVEYFDKIRGIFCGLTLEKMRRFLERNKRNFSRNCPHKPVMSRTSEMDNMVENLLEGDTSNGSIDMEDCRLTMENFCDSEKITGKENTEEMGNVCFEENCPENSGWEEMENEASLENTGCEEKKTYDSLENSGWEEKKTYVSLENTGWEEEEHAGSLENTGSEEEEYCLC